MAQVTRQIEVTYDDAHQATLVTAFNARAERGGRPHADAADALAELRFATANMIRQVVRQYREDERGEVTDIDAG